MSNKLTELQIIDIITSKEDLRVIAKKFNVSVSHVTSIKNGNRWKYLRAVHTVIQGLEKSNKDYPTVQLLVHSIMLSDSEKDILIKLTATGRDKEIIKELMKWGKEKI